MTAARHTSTLRSFLYIYIFFYRVTIHECKLLAYLARATAYYYYYYWSLLYSAILRSRADSLRSHVILHEWIAFYSAFFWISTKAVYLYTSEMLVWTLMHQSYLYNMQIAPSLISLMVSVDVKQHWIKIQIALINMLSLFYRFKQYGFMSSTSSLWKNSCVHISER